jgi:hypothetical protein
MTGRGAHRVLTLLMSAVMTVIGVALVAQALAAGALGSGRLLLGVLFLAAGVGRSYVEIRRGRRA